MQSSRPMVEPPGDPAPAQRLADALRGAYPLVGTLAVAAIAFAVVGFLALVLGALVEHHVVGGTIGSWDQDVARWFAERRTSTWNSLSEIGSHVGGTVTIVALVVVTAALLAWRRHWWLAAFVVTSLCLEALVYLTSTFVIVRNRPAVPRLEDLIVADSYPSGHTAASVAMYGCIAVVVWTLSRSTWWRALALAVAVLFPVIVATSRMYRGMHNPSDVLCGALLGAGCVLGGWLAAGTGAELAARRRAETEEPELVLESTTSGDEPVRVTDAVEVMS